MTRSTRSTRRIVPICSRASSISSPRRRPQRRRPRSGAHLDVPGTAAESAAALRGVAGRVPAGPAKEKGSRPGSPRPMRCSPRGMIDARFIPACGAPMRGDWRPLLAADGSPLCDPSPWLASGLPFLLESPSQFRTDGPNDLASAAYARSSTRSAARRPREHEADAGADPHRGVQTPSRPVWNGVARRLAEDPSRRLDLADSARLFAMLNLTAADAGINCWNDKYHYSFWRPITAIREADRDGNPATEADPTGSRSSCRHSTRRSRAPGLSSRPTPTTHRGLIAKAAPTCTPCGRSSARTRCVFKVTSSRFPGEKRYFNRFSAPIRVLIDARVWAGIH